MPEEKPVVEARPRAVRVQTIVSRQIDITKEPAVVSFGKIDGGVRNNIIPDAVELEGTIRTFDEAVRQQIHDGITRTATSIADSAGATRVQQRLAALLAAPAAATPAP